MLTVLVLLGLLSLSVDAVDDYIQSPPFIQVFRQFIPPNCFLVEIVVPKDLEAKGAVGGVIPTRQIEFDQNNNDFSLARELGFMAPTVWELFGDFKKEMYPAEIGKRATITKWSCGRTLLKIGTGGAETPLLSELSRGVGGYFRHCTEVLGDSMLLESCSVVASPRDQSQEEEKGAAKKETHLDRRLAGKLIDVQSLEWVLRSRHVPANALLEGDREYMERFAGSVPFKQIEASAEQLRSQFGAVQATLQPYWRVAELKLRGLTEVANKLSVSAKVKKVDDTPFKAALKEKQVLDKLIQEEVGKIVLEQGLAQAYQAALGTVSKIELEENLNKLEQDITALW